MLAAIDDIVASRDVDVSNTHYRASAMVRASYGMPRISDRGLVGLAGIVLDEGTSPAEPRAGGTPAGGPPTAAAPVLVDGSAVAVDRVRVGHLVVDPTTMQPAYARRGAGRAVSAVESAVAGERSCGGGGGTFNGVRFWQALSRSALSRGGRRLPASTRTGGASGTST